MPSYACGLLPPAQVVMMDLDLIPAGGMQARCDYIFQDASEYCRACGLNLHMSGLTKTLLGCATSADFPVAILGFLWHSFMFEPVYYMV